MMLLLFVCLMISSVFAMDIAKQFQLMMEQATAPVAQCPDHPNPNLLSAHDLLGDAKVQQAMVNVKKILDESISTPAGPTAYYASIEYRGSPLFRQGGGETVKGNKTPPSYDSIFLIASVSKVFTALTLMSSVARGKLRSFDVPVDEIEKDFGIMPYPGTSPADKITFHQLATQMSGLPREAPCHQPNCLLTTKQVLQKLHNEPAVLPPNTRPSYSNLGFDLLGHILADHEGFKSYQDLLKTNVFKPLQQSNSSVDYNEQLSRGGDVIHGYANGVQLPLYNLNWNQPAGGIWTSPRDLDKLARFYLNPQTTAFGSPATVKQALRMHFLNPDGQTGFGMPFENHLTDSYLVSSKGGNLPGYATLFSLVDDLDLSINVNWNGGANEFAVSDAIYAELLPVFRAALEKKQKSMPYPAIPGGIQRFVGKYVDQTNSSILTIGAPAATPGLISLQLPPFDTRAIFAPAVSSSTLERFRIFLPPSVPANPPGCFVQEMLAMQGQYVEFTSDGSGRVVSVNLPGFADVGWVKRS